VVSNSQYSVRLPISYVYQMSLSNANGYIINSGTSLEVTESSSVYDIAVLVLKWSM